MLLKPFTRFAPWALYACIPFFLFSFVLSLPEGTDFAGGALRFALMALSWTIVSGLIALVATLGRKRSPHRTTVLAWVLLAVCAVDAGLRASVWLAKLLDLLASTPRDR